jgi:hypothetical protein
MVPETVALAAEVSGPAASFTGIAMPTYHAVVAPLYVQCRQSQRTPAALEKQMRVDAELSKGSLSIADAVKQLYGTWEEAYGHHG